MLAPIERRRERIGGKNGGVAVGSFPAALTGGGFIRFSKKASVLFADCPWAKPQQCVVSVLYGFHPFWARKNAINVKRRE